MKEIMNSLQLIMETVNDLYDASNGECFPGLTADELAAVTDYLQRLHDEYQA